MGCCSMPCAALPAPRPALHRRMCRRTRRLPLLVLPPPAGACAASSPWCKPNCCSTVIAAAHWCSCRAWHRRSGARRRRLARAARPRRPRRGRAPEVRPGAMATLIDGKKVRVRPAWRRCAPACGASHTSSPFGAGAGAGACPVPGFRSGREQRAQAAGARQDASSAQAAADAPGIAWQRAQPRGTAGDLRVLTHSCTRRRAASLPPRSRLGPMTSPSSSRRLASRACSK